MDNTKDNELPKWKVSTPEEVMEDITSEATIGLIHASWGGSSIQAWMGV